MALIQNVLPPSRENWELVVYLFQFFPLITIVQWIPALNRRLYAAGKTSSVSAFNLPGKIGWITMEVPGFITLLYCMQTITPGGFKSLPWENQALGSLFVIHYIYRAILAPLIAPSMSPISPLVWSFAIAFQLINGLSLGGWLGGYGPISRLDWQTTNPSSSSSSLINNYKAGGRMELGLMIWALGFVANIWHDDELREIRRAAARNEKRRAEAAEPSTGKNKDKKKNGTNGVDKVYMIPKNGLFWLIFYPHYLCEWIEWGGFWLMASGAGFWGTGLPCVPARNFLFNEIATMLPRALEGRQWYIERFGREKVGGRKAIIPWLL